MFQHIVNVMNKEIETPKPSPPNLASLSSSLTIPTPGVPADPHGALRGIALTLSRWADAIRRQDIDALARLVALDAEFWTHGAPPLRGRDALAAAFRPLFDRFNMEQEFDCVELILSGNLAILRGTEINRLSDATGGEPRIIRQRAFSVLIRDESGEWLFSRGMTNLAHRDGGEP